MQVDGIHDDSLLKSSDSNESIASLPQENLSKDELVS